MKVISIFSVAALFAVCCSCLLAASAADALAPIKHSHLTKPDRVKWCGSDTDCVVVKEHGVGGIVKVDGLDFLYDTPSALRKKLPGWFGPKPWAVFVFENRVLDEDRPLAHAGVEVMNSIIIYPANEHQIADLEERAKEEAEDAAEVAAAGGGDESVAEEEEQLKQRAEEKEEENDKVQGN